MSIFKLCLTKDFPSLIKMGIYKNNIYMQKSAYNIIVPVSDKMNVLFNAMTKKFFYISKHNTAACIFMLDIVKSK